MLQGQLGYSRDHADILLTCGSTDGFSKVVGVLGSPGDNMLVEEFCYTNVVQQAQPFGIGTAPVRMDAEGMMVEGPGGLRDVLENWDEGKKGRRPHFMYTVSIGQNPTGATITKQRRKEVYALCERYDVIIVEDDPYWHLQYTETSHQLKKGSTYPFLAALELSYLTIDTSGRVIRLDTFSKTIAPGCRMGWITAQKPLIETLIAATEGTTQQPSGFVQSMVAELLCRSWGMDGWVTWLQSLRDVYEERMQAMCTILSEGQEAIIASSQDDDDIEVVSKTQLYSFTKPDGGMFVWVRINIASHPAYREFIKRGNSKKDMLMKLWDWGAITQKSLPSPGGIFAGAEECQLEADEFLRFCFAAIELEEVKDATKRWVLGIKAFWELKAWEIEKIGEEEMVIGTALGRRSGRPMEGGFGGFRGGKGRLEVRFDDFISI
jgi:DNA-binding transcriptional MocR family regulator